MKTFASLPICLLAVLISTPAWSQAPGAPQSMSAGVDRVGGFRPLTAAAPASAASTVGLGSQGQQGGQQGRPMNGNPAPAPMPYPRGAGMPSPEINLVNEAVDQSVPMTADEIRRFRSILQERSEPFGENATGRPVPKATTQIFQVDLSPSAKTTPPLVRIERNQGSIVSFLDAGGKPWPARVADNYSPQSMTVSQFTEHQLSISAKVGRPFNALVAVALEGLPTAIIFNVQNGQAEVDAQVVMMIPKYKDGAPPDVGAISGQASLNSGELMDYLLRTPPPSAKVLKVEGVPGVLAWQTSSSRMVIRSTSKVVSGYFRSQGVGDGTEVYEVALSPQVSFLYGDRMIFAKVSGFQVGGFGGDK